MTASWVTLVILFATGTAAGLMDAIAGGGGMITLPVLLGIGLPPQEALGTNKLQSTFGSGSAMLHFRLAGAISLRQSLAGIFFTAVGAAIGTLSVQSLDPSLLRRLIPILLVSLALYLLLSPRLGFEERYPRLERPTFFVLFGLLLGFYDGFFGPGTGTFWVMALMLVLGYEMTKATGYTKVMNFTSNIVALSVFLVSGHVHFLEGFVMGAGQFIGARIGAGLVMAKGARFIRPMFIAVAMAITIKLLLDSYR